jgi:RNA polymerase sigma-70 factor (ECF subfamily)
LLTAASRAGRFGRYQCEAAIQSVHVQRAVTGRLNLAALQTLYKLLVTHTDGIGARIGLAVVTAEAGDPDAALADLDALDRARTKRHQPFWVARGHVCALAGRADARSSFSRAIELTQDDPVRAFLSSRLAELE